MNPNPNRTNKKLCWTPCSITFPTCSPVTLAGTYAHIWELTSIQGGFTPSLHVEARTYEGTDRHENELHWSKKTCSGCPKIYKRAWGSAQPRSRARVHMLIMAQASTRKRQIVSPRSHRCMPSRHCRRWAQKSTRIRIRAHITEQRPKGMCTRVHTNTACIVNTHRCPNTTPLRTSQRFS